MKKIIYKTQGVCSQFIELEADDEGRVTFANVIGGCNGNLKGIRCGSKMTSCPDQIALAIEDMERQNLVAQIKEQQSMA